MINTNNKRIYLRKLANGITFLRLILAIPILLLLYNSNFVIAWLLIVLGAFTDWIDGWLARKSIIVSKWGTEFDPLADKILILAPLLWLMKTNILPLWSIWILISREIIITAWRRKEEKGGPANLIAKFKTSLQFLSVLLLLMPEFIASNSLIIYIKIVGVILFYISLLLSLVSAFIYLNDQLS